MDKKIKLPQELVLEILLRLPVKSLTRFKCVDWSWNDLFETTTFITMHHMQGQKKERLAIFEYEGMVSQCSSIKLISDNSQEVRDVEFHLDTPIAICPCGSYKGIFCLYGSQGSLLILWNPATREMKIVTPPRSLRDSVILIPGLGGDPNNNSLRIISFFIDYDDWNHPPSAGLYDLSTDSWNFYSKDNLPVKDVGVIPSSRAIRAKGILANGVFHWLAFAGTPDAYILCFDFRDNIFRKLELPPQKKRRRGDFLAEIKDSVAYASHNHKLLSWTSLEIWILEQDCCWTKKYNIGPSDWPAPAPAPAPDPIYTFWKDGAEFVGLSRPDFGPKRLSSYNYFDGQPSRYFDVAINPRSTYCVRKYVESIAPLTFFSRKVVYHPHAHLD